MTWSYNCYFPLFDIRLVSALCNNVNGYVGGPGRLWALEIMITVSYDILELSSQIRVYCNGSNMTSIAPAPTLLRLLYLRVVNLNATHHLLTSVSISPFHQICLGHCLSQGQICFMVDINTSSTSSEEALLVLQMPTNCQTTSVA